MSLVLAVSGGVDSVVLLDLFAQQAGQEIVVAHFDHGIRPDSAADARFVQELAKKYQLAYETKREELGPNTNEAYARERRYTFLQSVAKSHSAKVVTAHHADDVVETIAINITRGTGWRGLACLNSPDIYRPLLGYKKQQLYNYALKHELEWVEDETNAEDIYLRNNLRRKLAYLNSPDNEQLLQLHGSQIILGAAIDAESRIILKCNIGSSRYFFTNIIETVGVEILRAMLLEQNSSLTRPQRQRLLYAIKTARPGSEIQLGDGLSAHFTRTNFTVKTTG